jgi:hypothetical protein
MDLVYNEQGVLVFRGEGYTPPQEPAFRRSLAAGFGQDLALEGFALSTVNPQPGEEVEVTLYWRALEGVGPAYTAFLHLLAPGDRGVGGVDEPLLQGLYQPDLWPPGRTLPDRHRLTIPPDLSPGRYRLDLGLYPPGAAEQLLPVGDGDRLPLAALPVGQVAQPSPATELHVDLGPIRLQGYDLQQETGREASIRLTLYWQASRPVDRDYTVFVHVVDAGDGIPIQDDAPPGDPYFPTSTWLPGQTVVDDHTLTLPAGLPAGQYRVLVGLYHRPSNDRLPATDARGQLLGDAVPLVVLDLGGDSP